MQFASLLFLFVFLPVTLIVYYLSPKRIKNVTLVLASLVFYAWGQPQALVLMGVSLVFNYLTGMEIALLRGNGRYGGAKAVAGLAVAANLFLLALYKYAGFAADNLSALLGLPIQVTQLPLPLGLSFFTFTVLSYLLDILWGKAPAERNFLCFAAYVTMFPKLSSGPIVRYADIAPQLRERNHSIAGFGNGLNQFLVGLAKKVLLADNLGVVFGTIQGLSSMSAATAWLGCLCYSLQLYFDFSGYSDMAIGLARMLGFRIDKNFDYPYLSASVSEFWRRWHISLGLWFRTYVYIPMGGNRCSVPRQLLNLTVVWLLTGIWHGASWNFLVWGLWHGCFVILEKFAFKPFFEKIPRVFRHIYLLLAVMLGWVFFFSPSLGGAVEYLGLMFHSSGVWLDGMFLYQLSSNLPLLLAAVIGCGPWLRKLHQRLAYVHGGAAMTVSVIAYMLTLIACVAYLVSNTYSAFLYAQF